MSILNHFKWLWCVAKIRPMRQGMQQHATEFTMHHDACAHSVHDECVTPHLVDHYARFCEIALSLNWNRVEVQWQSWFQLKMSWYRKEVQPNTNFHTKLSWHWIAPPMCIFSALTVCPPHPVDCYIQFRVIDWCLTGYIWLIQYLFGWCIRWNFVYLHLEVDFDGWLALHPMRTESCNMVRIYRSGSKEWSDNHRRLIMCGETSRDVVGDERMMRRCTT